jgi:hypothetical protein
MKTTTSITRTGVKWGITLGAAVCLWTLAVHQLGFYTTRLAAGQRADLIATILPIIAVVLAVRERARIQQLKWTNLLAIGAVTGLVSAIVTVPFLWWYHHVVNPGWLDRLVEFRTQVMTAAGASAGEIATAVDRLRQGGTDSAQAIGGFIGSTVICVIVALIGGFVIGRRQRARAS